MDDKKSLKQKHDEHRADYAKYHENSMKYWRSWGSWFSWGSPVGLGLFFISIAFCVWLLGQTFGWN